MAALIGDFEQSDLEEDAVCEDDVSEIDEIASSQNAQIADVASEDDDAEVYDVDVAMDEIDETSSDDLDIPAQEDNADSKDSDDDATPKMSWAEFVELDDKMKKDKPKKHFWEKW